MEVQDIIKLKQHYLTQHNALRPGRYVSLESFRDQYKSDIVMDRSVRVPISELVKMINNMDRKTSILTRILAGEPIDDAEMQELFGFTMQDVLELEAQIDPIKKEIPDGLVLLSFDDATLDHYTDAAPVIERFHGHGNFLVCEMERSLKGGGSFSDKSVFMSWEQIAELHQRGHEIVNHSLHHRNTFFDMEPEDMTAEIEGIEQRCAAYGIPRPLSFGYPVGKCTRTHENLLHRMGYRWARGDSQDTEPLRGNASFYNPRVDSPLSIPAFSAASNYGASRLKEILRMATGGKVVLLAYHDVVGPDFLELTFAQQLELLSAEGARFVTFSDLEEYIDPIKAYAYTHMT